MLEHFLSPPLGEGHSRGRETGGAEGESATGSGKILGRKHKPWNAGSYSTKHGNPPHFWPLCSTRGPPEGLSVGAKHPPTSGSQQPLLWLSVNWAPLPLLRWHFTLTAQTPQDVILMNFILLIRISWRTLVEYNTFFDLKDVFNVCKCEPLHTAQECYNDIWKETKILMAKDKNYAMLTEQHYSSDLFKTEPVPSGLKNLPILCFCIMTAKICCSPGRVAGLLQMSCRKAE